MKKIIAAAMIGVICVSALAGCGIQGTANRKVIQKDDKQIVVIDDKQSAEKSEIALERLQAFENMRALDWIDENTILIMKDNEKMPMMQVEGGKAYPKNFYEFNLNTKEEKLVAESKMNMSNGILSPDKKHIFYKEGIEESMTGYILDRETGKKVQVTDIDSISSYEGRWLDNNTVIFASFPNSKIYTADINGKVTEIPVANKGMLNNAAKLGDKLYYTTIDGKLFVQTQNSGGKDSRMLAENVIWLIPSPDMTKFAMVKRTAETKMTLYITDLEGKELKELTTATQIFGTNWSPDQSRLTYAVTNEDTASGGVFVADTESGKSVQMTTDLRYAADPLRWSPSGKQISLSNLILNDNGPKFVTNILQLK